MVDGYIAEHGEDGTITFYYDDELKEIEEQKRLRQENEKLERERLDFQKFKWGFTTAACFLFFVCIVFSIWNTILGGLFFAVLYCYIPAILYVSLTDNSFISKKLSEKVLYFPVIKIMFFIEIILIILVKISPIILILFPVSSYFLSRKIYKISVLKQYNLVIYIFKDGFYKLRIGFLIIILFFLFYQ